MIKSKAQKNKDPISALFVMAEVGYLLQKGKNFAKSCQQLEDLDSKVVLSTLAIELLVKSYIGAEIYIQNSSQTGVFIKDKINKKFKCISHNFEKLFNNALELKKDMNIESIKRVNHTGFIDEYRFQLYNKKYLIFKTLEAGRYGAFSLHKDVFILADRKQEDEFLEKLSKVTSEKIRLAYVCLNKQNDKK